MRVLSVMILVAAGFPALAADSVPAEPWRYITASEETTTSRCIGHPVTPLCAAETLLACFQRGKFDLCRMVDDMAAQYAEVFATPAEPGRFLAYRVVGVWSAGEDPSLSDDPSIDGGDVVMAIDQREGALGETAPATGAPPHRFVLHPASAGLWKVTKWGGPND